MKKILIIDRDSAFAERLQITLADKHRLDVCADGQSGFYAIYEYKPDLVLLDVTIEAMNAASLVAKMRAQKQFQKLPILLLADTTSHLVAEDALSAGATELFLKDEPDAPALIVSAISRLLTPSLVRRTAMQQQSVAQPVYAAPLQMPVAVAVGTAQRQLAQPAAPVLTNGGNRSVGFLQEPTFARQSTQALSYDDYSDEIQAIQSLSSRVTEPFLDAYGQRAHAIRQDFIRYRSAAGSDSAEYLEQFVIGLSELNKSAESCDLRGLGKYLTVIESRAKQLRRSNEPVAPSSLQGIAAALDVLAALNNHLSELEPLNRLNPLALVVDDDDVSHRALCQGLEIAKIKTTAVDNPDSALVEAEAKPFDLIFLDVDLPKMNGFALCVRIRIIPIHRRTPVLFATSLNDIKSRASSRVSGGNGFVTKPVDPMELGLSAWSLILGRRILQHGVQGRI